MATDKQQTDLEAYGVCRHTVRATGGVYSFSAILDFDGYRVSLDYWQDTPTDEARERSTIVEKTVPTRELAVGLIVHWFESEAVSGFGGYQLEQQPVRVSDLYRR